MFNCYTMSIYSTNVFQCLYSYLSQKAYESTTSTLIASLHRNINSTCVLGEDLSKQCHIVNANYITVIYFHAMCKNCFALTRGGCLHFHFGIQNSNMSTTAQHSLPMYFGNTQVNGWVFGDNQLKLLIYYYPLYFGNAQNKTSRNPSIKKKYEHNLCF